MNVTSRVEARNRGYEKKQLQVRVGRKTTGREKVVELRVERGYRKGYKKSKDGRVVELSYTKIGTGVVWKLKSRKTQGRTNRVTNRERWGLAGNRGTYRRQTTEGRKTREDGLISGRGGIRRLWVK